MMYPVNPAFKSLLLAAALLAGCRPREESQKFSDAFSSRPKAACFPWAGDFSEGLAPVMKGGRVGFLDTSGAYAILPAFAAAGSFSGGRAPALAGGKWGYLDVTGRFAIPPAYDWAGAFREGFAPVASGGRYRFVDSAGDPLGNGDFAEVRPFSGGFAAVRVGDEDSGAWGFIDARGAMAIPPLFDGVPRGFSEGLAAVQAGADPQGRMGFIDTSGGFALDTLFDAAGDFSEGLAPVGRGRVVRGRGGRGTGFEGLWGFVDTTGRIAVAPTFAWAGNFHGGRALVRLRSGNWAFARGDGSVERALPDSVEPIPPLDGDRVAFRLQQRYGYLDAFGDMALPPRFSAAGPFREGWARARLSGPSGAVWVYVDRSGKYLGGNRETPVTPRLPKSR